MPQNVAHLLDRYRGANSRSRDQRLREEYGIDQATYARLAQAQGNVCAICHNDETVVGPRGEVEPLCVDHDHLTGRVRGLLCRACNAGLGAYKDNPNLMRAAATYLDHGGTAGEQHQPRRR